MRNDQSKRPSRMAAALLVAGAALTLTPAAQAGAGHGRYVEWGDPQVVSVQQAMATTATVLRLDDSWAQHTPGKRVRVGRFPLSPTKSVSLDLQAFPVLGPNATVVIGRLDGADISFDYDASRLSFFHGRVIGRPDSHVYLSLSDSLSTGYIDLGPGRLRYRISSRGGNGQLLAAHHVSVFEATTAPVAPSGIPLCGVDGHRLLKNETWIESPVAPRRSGNTAGGPSTVGLKHLELAVETDFELYSFFNDVTAAADYVVQMYGEVSAIYMRDVDTRVEVVFVRIWDNANDLHNGPQPLFEFYPYWQENMNAVSRDAAQFLSGRRDFPFGGQAFLSQLCDFHYGVVGYAIGSFPDPTKPHPYNFDVPVAAHELGHTSGTAHTHDNGIDTCDNPNTTPRRGPIMSYCGQTWSGMNANTDNYFHAVSQASMDAHIASSSCIVADCNMNGIDDALDIGGGTSPDLDNNGVPDECEDCNNNGTLDIFDIIGDSNDVNGNGVPDECEPDCNNNSVPDDHDISVGTSLDAHGNDVPDECEKDCNTNGTSDYSEIQLDMTLDKDRNTVLDSCQDCDTDGTDDLAELGGAHHLWVASGLFNEPVRQFLGSTGVLTGFTGATVSGAGDVIVRSNGGVLVSSSADDRVALFSSSGSSMGNFVAPGAGGLDFPAGLVEAPNGNVLVASRNTNSVLEFDGTTGAPLGAFVAAGSGGLVQPFGLTYGPNGNLFVTSSTNEVMEYNGTTGTFVRVFVSAASNGGLNQPRGLAFKPDGRLLIASYGTDEVLEYERGTGAPRGKWAQVGTATAITQDSPWGIRVGPNGHVYVTRTGTDFSSTFTDGDVDASHLTDARMFEYDVCTGDHRKTQIGGNDHGLDFATGFDFVFGFDVDCNMNEIQDSCDIASGTSVDDDGNGVPDECQVDCNNNGVYDRLDIYPYGNALDCNCNFVPDGCDLAAGSTDCNTNGILDECEIDFDCNDNGTQDICELANGTAQDCNDNGLLDGCENLFDNVVLFEDFEGGLPAGWSATGIFDVTGSCSVGGACNTDSSWAYAGSTGSCSYDDGQHGGLMTPPIELPLGAVELQYCSALATENGFDFADVAVNNVIVERRSGGNGFWETRVLDISEFAGETVQIVFRLQSDPSGSGTRGWLIDNVQITAGATSADCNDNGIPDVCDTDCDANGVADECEVVPSVQPLSEDSMGLSCNSANDPICIDESYCVPAAGGAFPGTCYVPMNRYIGVRRNPTNVHATARRISLDQDGDIATTNDVVVLGWSSAPVDPDGIGAWLTVAEIVDEPVFACWPQTVHIGSCAISPLQTYLVESISLGQDPQVEGNFSDALVLRTVQDWGDVEGGVTGGGKGLGVVSPPNGSVNLADAFTIVSGFQGSIIGQQYPWLDLDPEVPNRALNIGDVQRAVLAFQGQNYPFAAPLDCP